MINMKINFEKADLRWQLLRRAVAASDFCFASEAGMREQKLELNGIEDENIIYAFLFYHEMLSIYWSFKTWNFEAT